MLTYSPISHRAFRMLHKGVSPIILKQKSKSNLWKTSSYLVERSNYLRMLNEILINRNGLFHLVYVCLESFVQNHLPQEIILQDRRTKSRIQLLSQSLVPSTNTIKRAAMIPIMDHYQSIEKYILIG